MKQRRDEEGEENYTAFVRSHLPSLPALPQVLLHGTPVVNVVSSTPLSPVRDPPVQRVRSPPPDSHLTTPSLPASTTQRPSEPSGIMLRSANATTVTYGNLSVSTTGTDVYPSAGPLLRRVGNAEELPSPHESSHPDELPHLHDFLLQSSATSLNVTGKQSTPVETTLPGSAQAPSNSTTLPPPPPLPSLTLGGSPSRRSSGSGQSRESSRRRVSPRRRDPTALPHQQQEEEEEGQPKQRGSPATEELPARQKVRRNVVSSTQRSPTISAGDGPAVVAKAAQQGSHGALPAKAAVTPETVQLPGPTDTTRSFDAAPPSPQPAATSSTNPRTPADILSPSFQGNTYADIDAAAHAAAVAAGVSADLPIRETFPIPRYCPDDLLRGEDKLWSPGKPLRIAYVTWNMANKAPRMDEVSSHCIHPNAHIIVIGTQENGPYVGSNRLQKRWTSAIRDGCLGGQYKLVSKHHMWAIHMAVFARSRDVAKYVSRAHASHVKTGMLNGLGGNKGGVAVGLVLSLTPKYVEVSHRATTQHAVTTAPSTPRGDRLSTSAMALSSAAHHGGHFEELDADMHDGPVLSPRDAIGPSPPALLDATVMQHDADDDDHGRRNGRGGGAGGGSATGSRPAVELALAAHSTTPALDDDDGVFSPAEMRSRNASFDVTREQEQRLKQKKKNLRHSFKRKTRGGGGHGNGRAAAQHPSSDDEDDSGDDNADGDNPNYMTLLFITAHLAAHQGAVMNRNKDYREIVHGLQLGRKGPHKKFFKRLLRQHRVLDGDEGQADDHQDDEWDDDSSEDDVVPLSLPVVSAIVNRGKDRRDVTEEFDLTFFGGDLNYRINGTRKAIEYVIQHHRNIRSILINNDQLSLERARGSVFQSYQEGNLLFRPTYKYEVSKSNGGVTLDEYNFSKKKDRMPAYCDRVLFKKKTSSAARRIAIRLYTDVPNVRTSDHRPVVAMFDVGTRAYTGRP